MVEIHPTSYASIIADLDGLESEHQTIWNEIVGGGGKMTPDARLFVQVAYDEIAGEELDQVFGYSGIAQANRPIGLPCEFDAFTWRGTSGNETLLFPLGDLYSHFRNIAPSVYDDYEACGSMDAYVERKGDAMTALEYLVAGSMECISFCKRNRFVLEIRW